ncbi:MAG: sensor histidine kinase [Cellulosilyticaceae bacterium]
MVTLLRKLKYGIGTKMIAVLLLCLAAILLNNSLVGQMWMPRESNYYETYSFREEIIRTAGYVRDWTVRYTDQDIFNPEKLTQEELDAYKGELEPKVGIIKDRREYYENMQRYLTDKSADFDFIGINNKTDQYITNMQAAEGEKDALKQQLLGRAFYLMGDGVKINQTVDHQDFYYGYHYNYYTGIGFEEQDDYTIIVALKDDMNPRSWHYEQRELFEISKATQNAIYTGFLVAGVILVFIIPYLIMVIGRRSKDDAIYMRPIDRVPFELQLITYGGVMCGWFVVCVMLGSDMLQKGWRPYGPLKYPVILSQQLLYILIAVGVWVTVWFGSSLIRHIKNRSLSEYILGLRCLRWIGTSVIQEKTLPVGAVVFIIGYMIINGILTVLTLALLPMIVILIGFNVVTLFGVTKIVIDYNKIAKGITSIAEGDLETKISSDQLLPVMKRTAHNINNVGDGLEEAVQKTLKSERLKTELITNVSHDLKTPLTSIISYIDLLKDETIENQTAREYIEVLDERSSRLKQLIEDLVEASKAATGNIKSDLEVMELKQLVLQGIGEYADRLEENGLEVICQRVEDVKVLADGRHMCRIVENLLSNVCKYAMPHTRVYVEVLEQGAYGKIVIKNISNEPLAINPQELTERFVRGDEARSTEGSGLGLAIAQSLVEVQGGKMKIEIDGDLFKVEIEMPSN